MITEQVKIESEDNLPVIDVEEINQLIPQNNKIKSFRNLKTCKNMLTWKKDNGKLNSVLGLLNDP